MFLKCVSLLIFQDTCKFDVHEIQFDNLRLLLKAVIN